MKSGPKLIFNVLEDQIAVDWISQSAEGNFSDNTKSVSKQLNLACLGQDVNNTSRSTGLNSSDLRYMFIS